MATLLRSMHWSVFIDINIPYLSQLDEVDEVFGMLSIGKLSMQLPMERQNWLNIYFDYGHYEGGRRKFSNELYMNDEPVAWEIAPTISTLASLRIRWDASSKVIYCEYDEDGGAANWTSLTSYNIGSGIYNWGMTDEDTFRCGVGIASARITISEYDNVYIDNFQTTSGSEPTPIPVSTPTPNFVTSPTPLSPVIDSGDYDGDNTSDIGIFRASSGLWAIRDITRVYFGSSGDIPAPGDFDGDGSTDIAIFRSSSGLWVVHGITRVYFGGSNDTAVPGDYDADGSCDVAIYRPSSGLWAVRGVTRAYFGGSSDRPVPFYVSGRSMPKDIGIFRPSSGLWAIRRVTRAYFGTSGDEPVPANYYTLSETPGIYRASTGLWAIKDVTRVYFGGSSDQPIPGNYTGFIPADIGIFRETSGLWAVRGITRAYYGSSGDIPVTR